MNPQSLILAAITALAANPAPAGETAVDLARSPVNQVSGFMPRVSTDGVYDGRFVPHVYSTTPWGREERIEFEVPEFIWAVVDGDAHNDSPFFYGRAHRPLLQERFGWVIRHPTIGRPTWSRNADALELTSELEGGFTVHFQVVPRLNLVEIRSGVSNGSDRPMRDLKFALCAGTTHSPTLFVQHPRYSRLYSNGEVISWDGAGQSLEWIDRFQKPDGTIKSSIWLRAYLPEFAPPDWATMEKLQEGRKFFLDRFIDVPAIAKADREFKRFLVVHSPEGREAFTNPNTPCFHGNGYLDAIPPGQTRWTTTFYTFFEGGLGKYFKELKRIHEQERGTRR